eukprot:COSAG01_NODE_23637_length_807_cov_2.727401_1_plen_51_part_10
MAAIELDRSCALWPPCACALCLFGLTSRFNVRQMTNQKLTVKRLTPNHSLR